MGEYGDFDGLREPAAKVFACQVGQLPKPDGPRGVHVWVQGVVVRVNPYDQFSGLVVDDGTGLVVANGLNVVVKESTFRMGQYVMVVGHLTGTQLSDFGEDVHSVDVTKVTDLSSEPRNEALWPLEVMDIQTQLGGDDEEFEVEN